MTVDAGHELANTLQVCFLLILVHRHCHLGVTREGLPLLGT